MSGGKEWERSRWREKGLGGGRGCRKEKRGRDREEQRRTEDAGRRGKELAPFIYINKI